MATYRLKIKTFGLGNTLKKTAGSVLTTTGKALSGGLGKTAGFMAGLGAIGTGAAIGTAIAGPLGGLIGGLATPFVTKKATETVGEKMKDAGQDLKINAV